MDIAEKPTETTKFADLIARLEAADEGSDLLDRAIAAPFGVEWSADEDGNFGGYGSVPQRIRFTSNTDAAMMLVPKDWCARITKYANSDFGQAYLERWADNPFHDRCQHVLSWDTEFRVLPIPLAICIAAIKARALE